LTELKKKLHGSKTKIKNEFGSEGAAKNCKDRYIHTHVMRANEFGLKETVIRINSNIRLKK